MSFTVYCITLTVATLAYLTSVVQSIADESINNSVWLDITIAVLVLGFTVSEFF